MTWMGNTKMKICVIPDTQVKPYVPLDHLLYAGRYIADKKPDVVVMIGDWWDMESLCSYDKGKKSFEGRRYKKDIEAGNLAMDLLLEPIKTESNRLKVGKKKQWKPRLVFTMGNHEKRIERAVEYDAILEDTIGYQDLNLSDWEVYDYLQPVVIEGVAFAHFFTTGVMGRPVTSARALLVKKMMSCVMGHVQDRDIAYGKRADNVRLTGLFAGMFNQHDEEYLGNQGNDSWKGIWMLNEVNNGSFDELPVSLTYLKRKYGD
jgi:hypothetical protein